MTRLLSAAALAVTCVLAGAPLGHADPGSSESPETSNVQDQQLRDLYDVQQELNRHAQEKGAGQIQSWHVDERTRSIAIAVSDDADDRATRDFIDRARRSQARVTIDEAAGEIKPAEYLYNGQPFGLSNRTICSVGFNAKTKSGASMFLTAGHCARHGGMASRDGIQIGRGRGYSYPVNDFAAITIDRPGYWNPQGAVDKFDGNARAVFGHKKAAVGDSVCKGGRATHWTCGTVEALDQSVNYGNGNIVYGLVRFSACVDPGDSGGSVMMGNYAVGIASGAQFFRSRSGAVCGQKAGRHSVSFYQPVGEALEAFDARLVTTRGRD